MDTADFFRSGLGAGHCSSLHCEGVDQVRVLLSPSLSADQPCLSTIFDFGSARIQVRIRTNLLTALLRTVLTMDGTASADYSEGMITNFMAVDTQKVRQDFT